MVFRYATLDTRHSTLDTYGTVGLLFVLTAAAFFAVSEAAAAPCGLINDNELVFESSKSEIFSVQVQRHDGTFVAAIGPTGRVGNTTFVATVRPNDCDLKISYDGAHSHFNDYHLPRLAGPHTFIVSNGSSFTYAHQQFNDPALNESFFTPNVNGNGVNEDMYVEVISGGGLRFSPDFMWAAPTRYVDEFFTDDNWILPYQMSQICTTASSSPCFPLWQFKRRVFVTPQTTPANTDHSFQVNSVGFDRRGMPTLQSDKWFDEDISLNFAHGAQIRIDGALEAKHIMLTEAVAGQNWGGIRVEPGGSVELSNLATVEDAGIVVISGSLLMDNAKVADAPANGVYVSGGASEVLIRNQSVIRNSGSSGLKAENGAYAVMLLGGSTVINSGYANVRARGWNSRAYVADAISLGGGGDALLADSGGRIHFGLGGTVSRVNDYRNGLRSETYATVSSGSGTNRLVQEPALNQFYDVFAQDEAELQLANSFWGESVLSSANLQVYNPGDDIVVIDPVSTIDPGASAQAPGGSTNSMFWSAIGADAVIVSDAARSGGDIREVSGAFAIARGSSAAKGNDFLPLSTHIGRGTTRAWVETVSERGSVGDTRGALDALEEAFEKATSYAERQMVWGGATRFASLLGSLPSLEHAESHSRFVAFVSNELLREETAPWADRALSVYWLNRDPSVARQHARALIRSHRPVVATAPYGDGREKLSHAAFGRLLEIQSAVRDQSESSALQALAALAAENPYEAEAVADGLELVFAEADVRGSLDRAMRIVREGSGKNDASQLRSISSISASPNPSTGRVRLRVGQSDSVNLVVDVFDIAGRLVASAEGSLCESEGCEIDVDLAHLSTGIYVARVRDSGDSVRIVVSR